MSQRDSADELVVPPDSRWVHLCLDMQRIFGTDGVWPTPWMEKVLPKVIRIVEAHPGRTVFTKFTTPPRAEDARGAWRTYYKKWEMATREHLDPAMLDLLAPLARFCPPAVVIEKPGYSGFHDSGLANHLAERAAAGIIVTGSETEVCVLSTVLSAIDHGYPVILIDDAVCSSSDEGHDKMLDIYHRRYSAQVTTLTTEQLIAVW